MAIHQTLINGIDVEALGAACEQINADQNLGFVQFTTSTKWQGGTRTETEVEKLEINGEDVPRSYRIPTDEPLQLLGSDKSANPQELVLAGLAGCMMVGFVAGCSVHGVELESVEIRTKSALDLRGFLGLDSEVIAGLSGISYELRVSGSGTEEQYEAIHQHVLKTSPNFYNLAQPISVEGHVVLEKSEGR